MASASNLKGTFLAVAAAAVLLALAWPAAAMNTCLQCHASSGDPKLREPTKLFRASVHRRDEIGCSGCHGGDPTDPTVRAHRAPEGGVWRARPAREHIPEMCGNCHADARFVRQYNAALTTDQLTLYRLSKHGELAAAGDLRVPVCTTCHGTHDIVPRIDPRSPVRRQNAAKLCGGCHSDPEKMGESKLRTNEQAHWERSAHAKALAGGNVKAPSCPQCHGSHGAAPPGVDSVGRVCGSCHVEELMHFDKGPHSRAYRKLGFAECVPCHGAHDVPHARPLALGLGSGAACGKCHVNDERPKETARRLNELLRRGTDRAAAARAHVKRAERDGLFLAGMSLALAELTAAEEHMRPALHHLDTKSLEAPVDQVVAAAFNVEEQVARARRVRGVEHEGYYIALGAILLLFLLLLAKSWRLAKRRNDHGKKAA